MMVKDLIKMLLEEPMNNGVVVTVYDGPQDGPRDEEGEPPSSDHSVIGRSTRYVKEPYTTLLVTYPNGWS